MKFLSLLLICIFSSSCSANNYKLKPIEVSFSENKQTPVAGGNSFTIGGDTVDVRKLTAWFYGSGTIKTCINHVDSFGVSRSQVIKATEWAIQKWKKYFEAKKILSQTPKPQRVNTNFKLSTLCEGEEDLRLYFGTGPIFGNLRDVKVRDTLHQPVAFANKTHLAEKMQWSRGYIRFISQGFYKQKGVSFPKWKNSDSLKAVILHELGHVLGFEHTKGTVMDVTISEVAFTNQKLSSGQLNIDQSNELVFCSNCKETYEHKLTVAEMKSGKKISQLMEVSNTNVQMQLVREKKSYSLIIGPSRFQVSLNETQSILKNSSLLTNFPELNSSASTQAQFLTGHLKSAKSGRKIPIIIKSGVSNNQKQNEDPSISLLVTLVDGAQFINLPEFYKKNSL